ncbi:MAG: DUF4136 domain-containing protein [Actinomycetota bacterium]
MRMLAAAVLLTALLAGCGPQLVQTDVTRFHAVPAGQPRSFTILPDQAQRGSLEFENYAQQVAAQLQTRGWRAVAATPGAEAETVVFIHWGTGPGRTEAWSSPSSVYGGMGWGPRSHWMGGGVYDPFPYYETRAITYVPKWLTVDILDGPAWRAGTPRKVFEGRAVTDSGGEAVAPVVPYLIKALFVNFPGADGTTARVAVPVER